MEIAKDISNEDKVEIAKSLRELINLLGQIAAKLENNKIDKSN